MKNIILSLSLFALTACATRTPAAQVAPAPQSFYVDTSHYQTFKSHLTGPPAPNSADEKKDIATLKAWGKKQSTENCTRAKSEEKWSLQGFFGAPYGPLNEQQLAAADSFVARLRGDSQYFITEMKKEFARPRPFEAIPALKVCIYHEPSRSYPSGHTAQSFVIARALADVIPEKEKDLMARAEVIATDRILAGVHYPSDIEGGKKLANDIHSEMKKSKAYQDDVADLKKRLAN